MSSLCNQYRKKSSPRPLINQLKSDKQLFLLVKVHAINLDCPISLCSLFKFTFAWPLLKDCSCLSFSSRNFKFQLIEQPEISEFTLYMSLEKSPANCFEVYWEEDSTSQSGNYFISDEQIFFYLSGKLYW